MAAAGGGEGDSGDELEHDDAAGHESGYKVGYGKPPLHSRFQPGQSGNPAGRPKGRQTLARDLYEELQETIAAPDDAGDRPGDRPGDHSGDRSGGESGAGFGDDAPEESDGVAGGRFGTGAPGRISKQRAILRALAGKAMAGDARATALVLELVERLIGAGPPGEDWAGEDWGPESRDPWEDPKYAGMSARERIAARLDEMARRLGTDDEEVDSLDGGAPDGGAPDGGEADGGSPVLSGA
jgi:hypothetical protein